mgnify:CR=1 FL=1
MLFIGFGLRFGPQKEKEMSSLLFYAVFAIEFSPLILHCVVVTKALRRRYNKKEDSNFMNIFFHTKRRCLLILTHLAVGLSLVTAFKFPETISLSYQRGFAGFYCICAAYQAFRTWRDLLQPTVFEMFGWFEVVFKNIIELLAVHSWLLLTFVFAFYIQFNNFEEVDQKGWLQNCQFKFTNCTDIIIQLNANTELIKDDPELLADCMDFFQECTQSEAQAGNAFNNWKVVLKVLSMAAGELGYDDLPFGDNPITKMKSRIFAFQGSKRRMLLTIPIDSQNSLCEKSTQKWSQSSGSSRQVATKFMLVPVLAACVDGHIFGPLPRQKKAASRERVHTANVVLFREVVFLEQRIYNGEKIPLLLLLVFVLSQKQ